MRRKIAQLSATAFLLLFSLTVLAQSRTVTGVITDQTGAGVPGVTVTVKGTNNATQTDATGAYSISVPENGTLVFTAVGFASQEIQVTGNSANVTLTTAASDLNEVVVIGYGTARRRDLTGSVATVSAREFNRGVVTTPSQLIQGKVAGVLVVNNSGAPGGATTVRIRGNSSIRTGQQPLYVVDGVPLDGRIARPGLNLGIGNTPSSDPLYFINPFDISSMEVLKDASATAIYGSRGSNGVILITTKKGTSGQPKIDFNYSVGASRIRKKYDILDAAGYRQALKDYSLTSGDEGGESDAMEEILRTGITQNYNIGMSGGSENGRYRISLGYFDQNGIIKESELKKYTANINGQYRFLESRKLSIDFNLLAANNVEEIAPISNDAGFTGNLIGQALQWNPTLPLYKADGSINVLTGSTTINPVAMLTAWDDNARITSLLGNISAGYKFTDWLEYRFLFGINHQVGIRRSQIAAFLNLQGVEGRGAALYGNNELNTQLYTHTLNFNKELSETFNLNALLGYEYQNFDFKGANMSGQDFTTDQVAYTNIFQNTSQSNRAIGSFADPVSELQSVFARAMANFNDRLLLTATIRADGSSKFGENNRYGYFPSFAAAWNISNEGFMQGNSLFNTLKLRAGYGITGNQEFPSGAAQAQYTFGQGTIALSNVANPDLKWESTKQLNVGVDFNILRGKFFGAIDYFRKNTTDLLFNFDAIQPAPATRYWVNLPGNLINQGVELSLGTTLLNTTSLTWNFNVNASFLKNELQDYNGPAVLTGGIHGQGVSGATSQRLATGQPLNSFYLRQFEGLDATGTSIYTDKGNTLYFVGDPNPRTLLGISTDLTFGKFTATLNGNGAFGHVIYNNTRNSVLPIGNLGSRNIDASLVGNSIRESLANPITPSSRYLEKGDFFKLANATLAYRLGDVGAFRNANIYLTGQNLLIATKYSGFDPEINTDKGINGVPSFGIEYIPYPPSKTVMLGINFTL